MREPAILGYHVRQWWGTTCEDVVLCTRCFNRPTYAEQVVRAYLTTCAPGDAALICAGCLHELAWATP